ncbi:DUF1780 domain-containing protein [Taklimakanibacter deserti]|uniref:DUF1780 domain-containing protein n=1 Tax=Taklimakanibacter deserti TaxID=2267839 RepID=UPI000E64633C
MSSNDEAYLASLRTHAAETRTLFSNPMKPKRERMVVRAYLRCLGIPFTEDEIASSNDEPVDVLFGDARFQIRDIVGDRLRAKEWVERELRYQAARTVSDVKDPYIPSAAISLDQVTKMVANALAGKARHYAPASITTLDALVYLDLANSHLWPLEPTPAAAVIDELTRQCWRSVSLLAVPYGVVLMASTNAPEFLKTKAGLILNAWPGPDGWFEP